MLVYCPPAQQVASQDVSHLNHGLLVQAIKAAGSPLKLLVVSVQQQLQANSAPSGEGAAATSGRAGGATPVSILINKGPKGFGFNLSRIGDDHVFRVVDPGGPAAMAGARPGDVILKVRPILLFCACAELLSSSSFHRQA